jgi:hypothetical protein
MKEPPQPADYAGPERRNRAMYVTANTEYHFRDGVCVAVRDRETRSWLLTHPALRRPLSGSVRFNRNLEAYPTLESPRVGEGLFFGAGGPDVVTSNLLSIGRPEKTTVTAYPV